MAAALTVNDVAREVRCPTCNTPLDVSSAPVAQDMKAYIARRIEAGWTKQQIIDGLVDEFGKNVLATPPKEGFDLIAWVVPGLFVALGPAVDSDHRPALVAALARRGRGAPRAGGRRRPPAGRGIAPPGLTGRFTSPPARSILDRGTRGGEAEA